MDLAILRKMRKRLLAAISREDLRSTAQKPIGVGAGGDKTFPIDKLMEDAIFEELRSSGLPLTLISEEAGIKTLNGGGMKVLIDPVDGSKNAISGIPFFCTSIAIVDGETIGDITLSYVLNLITGDEFYAEKTAGAFLNGRKIVAQEDAALSLVAYEAPAPGKDVARIIPLLSQAQKTRCFGSTALDLAYLALGSISIFVTPSPSRSFDFAGGWLLVREAGGMVTDLSGHQIDHVTVGLEKSTPLIASGNAALHEKALRLLNR